MRITVKAKGHADRNQKHPDSGRRATEKPPGIPGGQNQAETRNHSQVKFRAVPPESSGETRKKTGHQKQEPSEPKTTKQNSGIHVGLFLKDALNRRVPLLNRFGSA